MNENKRYEKYLNRLTEDAKQLYVDINNLMKFYDLINSNPDYRESIHRAPGALYSFVNSLQTSIVIRTHKLYDNQSLSLQKLVNFAKTHLTKIIWSSQPPDKNDLDKQLADISKSAQNISKLKNQRDKNYAHLATKVAVDIDDFAKNNPLNESQIVSLVELSHEILIDHYAWKHQGTIEMKNVNSIDIKSLLELIRVGAKYQRKEIEDSLNK